MRVSRVRLINFANFSDVDVETGESIVIVGENKVGKSNFIRGLQLILDPGLSERDRPGSAWNILLIPIPTHERGSRFGQVRATEPLHTTVLTATPALAA